MSSDDDARAAATGTAGRASLAHEVRQLLGHWRRTDHQAPPYPLMKLALALAATAALVLVAGEYLDERLIRAAPGLPPAAMTFFRWMTDIGTSAWMWAVAAPVAAWAMSRRRTGLGARVDAGLLVIAQRALYMMATLLLALAISQTLKQIVGRGRPTLIDQVGPFYFDSFALRWSQASFPSGHSTTAFAASVALAFFAPGWRAPLLTLAVLIAVSRVALGVHYPSDVIAGAFVGTFSALFVARAFARRGIAFIWRDGRLVVRGRGLASRAAKTALRGQPRAAR
ncbi:MAG: phosphatase PAP2 family protein [Rhizobiales bacterium]|nr:phosphatase PAP2 family protein [Hyphomicrobiales bacterium]